MNLGLKIALRNKARRKRMKNEKQQQTAAKAKAIWQAMNKSEKHGVRFGMFPAEQMRAAEKEGFDGHQLSIALMDCAKDDGGMIG